MGFILTQWGMEVFNVFHSCSMFFIVFAFAMIWRYHWSSLHFSLFAGLLPQFSLNFHVHLWSTAKLNCLSLRRWTTLAMPGWQAPRKTTWMGTPTRATLTSSWWNSMPRASTCGRASVVVSSLTLLSPFRRTGCDFVFEPFPWRKNMEKL